MKLFDRLLLWVLSVLAVLLGLLLIILVLFPSLAWLQVSAVRVTVGVLALVSILAAVGVNLNVISDMAKKIAQDCDGVRACKSAVKNNGGGVDLELEMALNPGVAVAPLAAMLQERLKNRIFEMTGIRVGKVGILVEAASEAKETKPAPVEQLPSRVK